MREIPSATTPSRDEARSRRDLARRARRKALRETVATNPDPRATGKRSWDRAGLLTFSPRRGTIEAIADAAAKRGVTSILRVTRSDAAASNPVS